MNFCDRAEKCVYDENCPNYLNCEGIPPDEEEITLTEKMATAIEAVALITMLVRPDAGKKFVAMIEAEEKRFRDAIARAVGPPPEK